VKQPRCIRGKKGLTDIKTDNVDKEDRTAPRRTFVLVTIGGRQPLTRVDQAGFHSVMNSFAKTSSR
jgi:hypothetical protein